jgi:cyclopropane-fatty-acyl-phospholipid synthase
MDMMAGTHDWDARISSWLKPDGKFFLQHQVHASFAYYSDSAGLEDFPGNSIVYPRLVPSAEMLMMFQQYFSVEDFWKISGDQYRMTADKWLKRFYFYRMSLMPLLEKAYGKKNAWTWLQRWRLYLLATSEKSGFNRGQEWILGQYLFSRRTGSQSFSA